MELAGLERLQGVIFALEAVTRTARIQARAWKATLDPLLEALGEASFDAVRDYRRYLQGHRRLEGIRSFLAARAIPASEARIARLAAQKDAMFLEALRSQGVEVLSGTVAFIGALRRRGMKIAVVSASRNCKAVLEAAGLAQLFDERVDGDDAARLGLAPKPAPDMLLCAAAELGVAPQRAAVVESSRAGVEAARRGGFASVIGLDGADHAAALRAHGASPVLADLGELSVG